MAGNTKRKNKRGLAFVSIFLLLILAAAGGVSSDKNKDNTTGTTEAGKLQARSPQRHLQGMTGMWQGGRRIH